MKGIEKALRLLCASTVVFLLFIGTDQSAVPNIVKRIVHTAWLSVAPILQDIHTAPQLRIDPEQEIQSTGVAGSAAEGIATSASALGNHVPSLTDAASSATATGPARTPSGAGSCGERCGEATFSAPSRDSLTSAPRANGGRGSDGGITEVAASSRQNCAGINASAAGSTGGFRGALGRAQSNASSPATANRGTIGTAESHGIAIGGAGTVAGSTGAGTTNGNNPSLGSNTASNRSAARSAATAGAPGSAAAATGPGGSVASAAGPSGSAAKAGEPGSSSAGAGSGSAGVRCRQHQQQQHRCRRCWRIWRQQCGRRQRQHKCRWLK